MLSFKQWLFESVNTLDNPKTPREVFAYFQPMDNQPTGLVNEASQFVFKALYDPKKDKLYTWWVGNDYHGNIFSDKATSPGMLSNNADDIHLEFGTVRGREWLCAVDGKRPIWPVIYFDAEKRILEIITADKWTQDHRNSFMKQLKTGKHFNQFIKHFKSVEFKGWNQASFRIYF